MRVRWLAALALLLAGCGSSASGRLYRVGDHHLYLACVGTGTPVVVLEAGLGGDSSMWTGVLRDADRIGTRVCAYDRLGLGRSDRDARTRPLARVAADLHALVRSAGIGRPFVLAAHSMGGLIDRTYARRYPDDVAGLVLLDTVPDDWDRYVQYPYYGSGGEHLDVAAASAALRRSGSLGAKPVVVVKAETDEAILSLLRAGNPGRTFDDFQAYWDAAQPKLARISTNSVYLVAKGSDHDVPHERPALTLQAIRAVVVSARTGQDVRVAKTANVPNDAGAPQTRGPTRSDRNGFQP